MNDLSHSESSPMRINPPRLGISPLRSVSTGDPIALTSLPQLPSAMRAAHVPLPAPALTLPLKGSFSCFLSYPPYPPPPEPPPPPFPSPPRTTLQTRLPMLTRIIHLPCALRFPAHPSTNSMLPRPFVDSFPRITRRAQRRGHWRG